MDANDSTADADSLLRAGVLQACRTSDIKALQSALDKGWSFAGQPGRWSPLLEAVQFRQEAACAFLLEHGADLHLSDSTGSAALHWACQANKVDDQVDGGQRAERIIKLLMSRGASVEAMNLRHHMPIHTTVLDGATNRALALIEGGCPPDIRKGDEPTALQMAAARGFRDMCMALISRGASLELTSRNVSAEGWAESCSHPELAAELRAIRAAQQASAAIDSLRQGTRPVC